MPLSQPSEFHLQIDIPLFLNLVPPPYQLQTYSFPLQISLLNLKTFQPPGFWSQDYISQFIKFSKLLDLIHICFKLKILQLSQV